ncbi:MAG: hypothetical protein Q8T03_05370 [Bacteroidota bacterium]|nr:hypothetical protein [Bacteroidota bacterium]
MKKIFILFLIISFGKVYSQAVSIYTETFGTTQTMPAGWSSSGDFYVEDPANIFMPPLYTTPIPYGPGSGGDAMTSYDGVPTGVQDIVSAAFSTLGRSNITMDFNAILESGSSRSNFTLSFSTDNGATFPITVPFTNVANNNTWAAISTINLPGSVEGFSQVRFKISFSSNATGEYYCIDDIDINGVPSPVFYYSGSGAVDTFTNWGTNINGTGTAPTNFTATGQTFYLINAPTINLNNMVGTSITFGGATSMLHVGTGTTNVNLIIPVGFSLINNNGCVISVNNQATLTLQNTTFPSSNITLASGSTIDYAQAPGGVAAIQQAHHNLTVSGGADLQCSANFTVNNTFNLANGNYVMSATPTRSIFLNGTITGPGLIKTALSGIVIGGSGNFGTMNFGNSLAVRNFIYNRAAGTLTLGTNLSITAVANLTAGSIDLNGKALTLNGAITLPASPVFKGSTTSSLTIGGSGTISGSLLMDQTSASTKALSDLTLNRSSANLTLGNAVEIWGAVTPSIGTITTGGNLTVKQDVTNKGRIGTISTGGFSGNVTVETFILGGNTGWALLGAGGISGKTMNDWYGQFPMAIEGSATGVTSAGGYFESVQGWNEADAYGYDTTITVSTPLGAGKGFWTYLGTGPSTTSDIIITLSGTPVTGNVTMPLTNSAQSGTNLVANPYASPISWTALRNGNPNVTNAIYIYNADGPYASFVNGVGTNGGSDAIAEGQGFYVEALTGTSLAAKETNKIASSAQVMKLNSATVGLPIKLKINGFSADYDETAIRFHGSATNAYDIEYDARKIFQTPGYVGYPGGYSKYTTISTKGGNLDYSINSLPFALTQNAVIPVLVKVMATGQYTITGIDMTALPPNACVTLKDKLLNVTHNIKASPYVFTINDTTSTARFELTVCADITTGLNDNNSAVANLDESVIINNDLNGVYVNLNYDKATKTKISVTNILGQKIIDSKNVTTQNEKVYLGLQAKNQLIFVTVETENNKVTKKIIH